MRVSHAGVRDPVTRPTTSLGAWAHCSHVGDSDERQLPASALTPPGSEAAESPSVTAPSSHQANPTRAAAQTPEGVPVSTRSMPRPGHRSWNLPCSQQCSDCSISDCRCSCSTPSTGWGKGPHRPWAGGRAHTVHGLGEGSTLSTGLGEWSTGVGERPATVHRGVYVRVHTAPWHLQRVS